MRRISRRGTARVWSYGCRTGHKESRSKTTVGCAPSRMAPPNRPWFWIASLIKRKASTRSALAYDVHYAVVAPHGRPLALYLPPPAEHVRYRRSVPGVPPPLDLNPMSFVCPLVAAFRLVSAMTRNRLMVLEFAASFANACWRSILNHGDNEILWRCTTQQGPLINQCGEVQRPLP